MKTRKQSEVGGKGESAGTLNDISQDAVGKGLMRANANSVRIRKNDNVHQCQTIEPESGSRNSKRKSIGDSECYSKYKESSASSRMKGNAEREEEMDESDWEDGPSHTLDSRDNYSNDQIKEVTIEFNALPDSSKRKPVHRASAEDKEVAELVHKVHLLCLLARGRIIDNACDDPLIQASLLSILPKYLMRISNVQKLSPKDLAPLVSWFHENFHVKGPCTRERLYPSALAYALERREGTPEEVAALSVALFRALNFTTRFVSILDVASLKPESSNEAVIKSVQGIFSSSTPMVHRTNMVSTTSKISSCHDEENTYARDGPKRKNWASGKTNEPATSHTSDQLMDGILDSLATGSPNSTKETPKRKGDFEFEMQLEMALAATATGGLEDNMNSELSNADNGASNFLSLGKRLKRNKSDELSASSRGISTAIGSKKVGSPLYWAEVYFNGENLTGKWVHVDAVNAIIDGENNVEAAAAACKTSLRYAVAFAGHGAKDVTRRYCMKWYKISSQRISLSWWDSVLAPLKALESGATTGLVNVPRESGIESLEEDFKNSYAESSVMNSLTDTRTSLEDLELETRALTEPLPTNQQAYKNHHLYALERWLTKHQTLHPKGPVLGFCSGHPVYPRTCVQTLQTKERWLREGLQPKSDELPTKVLRRPHKLKMVEVDDIEGDCGESIALYGKWQMEPLFLPRAVNGIVPRNERGQVDVWSEKCLPLGTVHLRLPRAYTVAKRLEIDSAPAMVGFEFRNGRSFPVFDGIVVCTEFKDAILEAYAEEAAEREVEEKRRNEEKAISRWYQLLSSIVTRQRLNNCYGSDPLPQTTNDMPSANHKPHIKVGGSGDGEQSLGPQQEYVQDKKPYSSRPGSIEDHIHVFLKEDQNFDEESLVWTKRCHCGFSIEVEEF